MNEGGMGMEYRQDATSEEELRSLHEALAASEARFRSIIEKNADGVLVIDGRGIIRFVNPAAEVLMCRDARALIGTAFGVPIMPGDTTELDLPCPDGDTLVVEMRLVETEWDGRPAYLASLRDVSGRKRSEEAIRSAEERFRRISEAISDFTYSLRVSDDGRLVMEWLTDAFRRVTGYTPAEVHALGWTRLVHPDDQAKAEGHLARILSGESDTAEFRIITGGGEIRWLRNAARTIRDPVNNRLFRIYGAGQDVTDRRLLEEELRRRIEELAELDRRKDEFLAMLAHELRNPLAPIRNAVHVMRRMDDPQVCSHMRDIIGHQVDHLARLVDDLLDVTRITRGKIRLRPEPTDMRDVMVRAVEPLRPLFENQGITLEVTTGDSPLRVLADPVRIQQVLSNLLHNALKYTDSGGTVRVGAERAEDQILVRVQDTGIGIAPEMLCRVFDPFAQADASLDRSRGGLGIGLTLARRLMLMHGGELTASSKGPGCGSEFVIQLPAHDQFTSATPKTTSSHLGQLSPPQDSASVLIVDDNVEAASSLAILLNLWGYRVHVAHDGPEAIEAARRLQPPVVLLDIGLPKLDGYQVARALRTDIGLEHTTIIAMTGYGQQEDRRRSRDAGFDMHLVKPVDLTELESILGDVSTIGRVMNRV